MYVCHHGGRYGETRAINIFDVCERTRLVNNNKNKFYIKMK